LAAVLQLGLRIVGSYAGIGLFPHPLAVLADVLREAARAAPAAVGAQFRRRGDRLAARPLRRNLDERLVDDDRDGIEVTGVGLEADPVGLERNRAPAREGVKDGRDGAVTVRLGDLLANLAHDPLV